MTDAESERIAWAFLLGMLLAMALCALGVWASEPTPEELYEFRERLCSGYPGE